FCGHRTHDEINGNDHTISVLFAHQNSFYSGERAAQDANFPSYSKVRVRLQIAVPTETRAQHFHFKGINPGQCPVKRHETDYTGELQNTQAVFEIDAHENVSWKQWELELFVTVLPMTNALIKRQKA